MTKLLIFFLREAKRVIVNNVALIAGGGLMNFDILVSFCMSFKRLFETYFAIILLELVVPLLHNLWNTFEIGQLIKNIPEF